MIECLYYYPMKHKEGVPQWIIGHCGLKFTNWKLTVSDCALVRGKDDAPCFLSPPQKKYKNKEGKWLYVRYWTLDDEDMFEEFQKQAKVAIVNFCKERDMEIPKELCESS